MVGIVDYNAGNITSVEHALEHFGLPYVFSKDTKELSKCDRLIVPGDGDAAYAMKQMHLTGFDIFLKDWTQSGKPLLGICVGAQIIFDYSEEGDVQCLGLLKGNIRFLGDAFKRAGLHSEQPLKVPHMGWNDVTYKNGSSPLFDGIPEHTNFYFIHSYYAEPEDNSVIKAVAHYGLDVPACVAQNNVSAMQFHPEKSGERGLKIIQNYCSMKF